MTEQELKEVGLQKDKDTKPTEPKIHKPKF